MIKGLDVSSYNPNYRDEAAGCDFMIIKAGEDKRSTNYRFTEQLQWARSQGLAIGTYYWLRPGEAREQARWYVAKADPRADEFLVVDWEKQDPRLESRDPSFDEVLDFIDEVRKLRPRHKVVAYENKDFWETRAKKRKHGDALWLAWYGKSRATVEAYPGWTFWQYAEAPDYNLAKFDSRAEMKAWARGGSSSSPTPKPEVPVINYTRPALRERVYWRGRRACTCMIESIEKVVEPRLKAAGVIKHSIDIWQGAYSHAAASANTHAGGGAIDVDQFSDTAVRIWREAGWAFWRRGRDYDFMPHGHGILIGCPHVSSGAAGQIRQYRNGTNGLVDHARDPHHAMDVDPIDWDDAIRDYLRASAPPPAAGGGGSTPALDPLEEFLMSAKFRRINTDKLRQPAGKPGEWRYLYLTDKRNTSFTAGPADWWGHLNVKLEGLPEGESAYFRIVEDEVDEKGKTKRRVTYRDHNEIPGTGGGTYRSIPIDGQTGKPDKDGEVYVRVQWHASVPTAVISYAEVARRSTGR